MPRIDVAERTVGCDIGVGAVKGKRNEKSSVWQLGVFVPVLIGLNFFFGLHISIIGSLILTLGLSFLFSRFRRRG